MRGEAWPHATPVGRLPHQVIQIQPSKSLSLPISNKSDPSRIRSSCPQWHLPTRQGGSSNHSSSHHCPPPTPTPGAHKAFLRTLTWWGCVSLINCTNPALAGLRGTESRGDSHVLFISETRKLVKLCSGIKALILLWILPVQTSETFSLGHNSEKDWEIIRCAGDCAS